MPSGDLTLYTSGYSLLEKTKLAQSEQRRQETLDSSGRPKVERFFIEDTYSVVAPRAAAPSVGVSSTTFTSESFATDFAVAPTPTVFATPSPSPSIGFPSGFIPDFSSGATEFVDPSQAAGGGPDLVLDRGYVDEPNRLRLNQKQSPFSHYLIVYGWSSGSDLDTRTSFITPTVVRPVDEGASVGWSRSTRLISPEGQVVLEWGGDTIGVGPEVEHVLLTNKFAPGISLVQLRLAAFWFSTPGSSVFVEIYGYRGGVFVKSGTKWINPTADKVELLAAKEATIPMLQNTSPAFDGYDVGTVTIALFRNKVTLV